MLNFISFGSGSSGNCYLLYTETDALLIDVGIGTRMLRKYFREYDVPLSRVKNILITHDHADHVKSVGKISKDLELPVYTTRAVHSGIDRNYCVRCKIPSDRVRVIEKGEPFQLGEFHITPFSVPHDSADNVGYRIDCQGVVFCIMTDVGTFTDEMRPMVSAANYLVIEANYDVEMLKSGPYPAYLKTRIMGSGGHLSNNECAKALAENATSSLRHVWLCHLSEENNHPELARKTVEQVLRSHGIVAGKDFLLDILKRTTPTGGFTLVD
ncbi:MAG: MBL fold metallo-hydrolase [Prevotella sp.]|nr:MBL fold metallo-hydrolase [Prevotella sp.]